MESWEFTHPVYICFVEIKKDCEPRMSYGGGTALVWSAGSPQTMDSSTLSKAVNCPKSLCDFQGQDLARASGFDRKPLLKFT